MGHARETLTLRQFAPTTSDGWQLELCAYSKPDTFRAQAPPLLLIPGYGMNCHPLTYHPNGPSLTEFLCERGFEVWTANLRGQGRSHRLDGKRARYGFEELALIDLPRALALVAAKSESAAPARLVPIGCSLGASLLYVYLAHHPEAHPFKAMVSIGGPLRWGRLHPLLRLAFASPALVGRIPIRGARPLARLALPLLKRSPKLLSLYLNADIVDLDAADELVKTVENPNPELNRQIARWTQQHDLIVAGKNCSQALKGMRLPLLTVLANADRVVTPEAALSVRAIFAPESPESPDSVDVLQVGDAQEWYAHADLFVSRSAARRVFTPLAEWIEALD